MRLHPILSQKYALWWSMMAGAILLKIIVFGYKQGGLSKIAGYEQYGMLFWVFGIFICGLVYSIPFYLLYRLFFRKWNDKVLMILISSIIALLLIFAL